MADGYTDLDISSGETVRDSTHIPLGVFSILLGSITGYLAWSYDIGRVTDMGAGYFPFVISIMLVLLGIAVLMRGGDDLPAAESRVSAVSAGERKLQLLRTLRVLGSALGGLVVFALILKPAGMVVSVIALVGIVSFAHPGPKFWPTLVLAFGLAAFSAVVFVILLKVQIGIWPGVF